MAAHLFLYDAGHLGEKIAEGVVLPADFMERVNRYKHEETRSRSLCAYALLYQKLLEQGIEIESIVLTGNQKPDFTKSHFNISHSGDMVAVMISNEPCGVDIQLIDEAKDYEGVAKRVLSEELYQQYLAAEDRAAFFAKAWAMLEAKLKREGCGVATDHLLLDSLDYPYCEPIDSKGRHYCLSYCCSEELSTLRVIFEL